MLKVFTKLEGIKVWFSILTWYAGTETNKDTTCYLSIMYIYLSFYYVYISILYLSF